MAVKQQNIHDGHRKRLTTLIDKAGLENVSDVQAVEYLLTYFSLGEMSIHWRIYSMAHKVYLREYF